jgi:chromosome segregation ATPase
MGQTGIDPETRLRSISMPLFGTRRSMLEVQNRALIKMARERAERIDELERELQIAGSQIGQLQRELQTAQERTGKLELDLQMIQERTGKLERDLQTTQHRTGIERDLQQAANEVERLTLERDFYSKRASALEEQNRELSESATKYSLWGQKLERELTEAVTKHQKLERELTETATQYSLWGQKLERELNRIDPDGAPSRRFGGKGEE